MQLANDALSLQLFHACTDFVVQMQLIIQRPYDYQKEVICLVSTAICHQNVTACRLYMSEKA